MANDVIKTRNQYVAKSNDLVRKSRYSLTNQQQKIILYYISMIKPDDEPHQRYTARINDIGKACGLDMSGQGFYYQALRDDIIELTRREWVQLGDGIEGTVSWFNDVMLDRDANAVSVTFHPLMAPHLFDLRGRYTQYQLGIVLAMRGKYSIRLYEYIRSHVNEQSAHKNKVDVQVGCELSELRSLLSADKYTLWHDFHRYVIVPAVDEINNCDDTIHVEVDWLKNGRTVTRVLFYITDARAGQALHAQETRRKRLYKHG